MILASSSFRLADVVAYQQDGRTGWNVIPQFLGFLVFLIASFAETNRLPFDLPEAESELVAGFHTEYSAMRFGAFHMAEYINMVLSALGDPLLRRLEPARVPPRAACCGAVASLLIFRRSRLLHAVFVWVRWTFPASATTS